MKAPATLTPAWVRDAFPALQIVERTPHELDVSSAARAHTLLTLRFAHADATAEGTARWANHKQVLRRGRVTESSPSLEEPESWDVPFEVWAVAWLELLGSDAPGPVRPGRLPTR